MIRLSIRSLRLKDTSVLWTMLMHAAHESDLVTVKATPDLARYVEGWERAGDLGVVAKQANKAVGAAWVRLWSEGNRGYGHVSDEVPELAIAVIPEVRGQGIGSALLENLLSMASAQFPAISLSIRADNPAQRLYERNGFLPVEGTEVTNRAGGVSFSMIYQF